MNILMSGYLNVLEGLYKRFGGQVLVPLRKFLKYPDEKGWNKKYYKFDVFLEDDITGLGLRINNVKDLICIDIDKKELEDFEFEIIERYIECNLLNRNDVYVEKSISGGFHIFMFVNDREGVLSEIKKKFKMNSRYLCRGIEIYPEGRMRQIVIYPSFGYEKLSENDLFELNCCVDEGLLYDFLEFLCRVVFEDKAARPKKVSARASSKSKGCIVNDFNDEIYVKLLTERKYYGFRLFLWTLEGFFKSNKKKFENFLGKLGFDFEYCNVGYKLNKSLISEYGEYDVYVYSDSLVYYDFNAGRALQFLALAFCRAPAKFMSAVVESVPSLYNIYFDEVNRVLKKFGGYEFFKFLIEYIEKNKDIVYKDLYKLCDIGMFLETGNKDIVERIKKYCMKGQFGRAKGVILRFIGKYEGLRKYVLKSDIGKGLLKFFDCKSRTLKSIRRFCRALGVSFALALEVAKWAGFKLYWKWKKCVRASSKSIRIDDEDKDLIDRNVIDVFMNDFGFIDLVHIYLCYLGLIEDCVHIS